MGPLFFVSYASSTGDRGPVQRLHSDVQKEIHSLLGRGPGTSGRLKRAAPTSEPDPAVLDSRCMVALYSADYLRDRQCGKEWSVFLERMNRRTRKTGQKPASLVGVLWRPEGLVLPRIVADTGQILDDVGQGYRGLGALGLMQDPGGWDGYRLIVRRIAQRIAQAAATPLPEMTEADSRAVSPRFSADRPQRADAAQPAESPRAYRHQRAARRREPHPGLRSAPPPARPATAERHVIVALVTGDRGRMEELRRSVSAYGETAQDWRPFEPHDEEPAVSIVRRALRACDIDRMTVIPLPSGRTSAFPAPDEGAPQPAMSPSGLPGAAGSLHPPGYGSGLPRAGGGPPGAGGSPQPAADTDTAGPPEQTPPTSVVVLIDPWMTGDATFPALWSRLQRYASSVAAVIVVLSRGDEETWANAARLRHALIRTPAFELDAPHHEAGSPESLAHTVVGALADSWLTSPETPVARPGDLSLESPVERFSRRQRERAAWVTSEPAPLPSLSGTLPGDLWGGG
jgi:hypothetical protein